MKNLHTNVRDFKNLDNRKGSCSIFCLQEHAVLLLISFTVCHQILDSKRCKIELDFSIR